MTITRAAACLTFMLPAYASARMSVTKMTCDGQQGMAVTDGSATVRWQLSSDVNDDRQTAWQVRVAEALGGGTVYDSGTVTDCVNYAATLPTLRHVPGGYTWQVRVWDSDGEPSEWSAEQPIRVVPALTGVQWIGAISREDARIPEGSWSNEQFNKDGFSAAWADVDTLSRRSVMLRREFATDSGRVVADAAAMTGNAGDRDKYALLAEETTEAFNRAFYHPDSCSYGSGSQASNAIPLYMGIVEEKNRAAVTASLTDDIAAHGNRLTTGDVGNRYLFRTLADNGRNDLLYSMLNHYETPGYGYQLTSGATTLTEQWDSRKGSSWNHFMMGQIDEWLFRSLAGIQQQEGSCGMRHLLIRPWLPDDMEYVKASTASLYGNIGVHCTRHSLTVSIPVGCDALIVTPDGNTTPVGSGVHSLAF